MDEETSFEEKLQKIKEIYDQLIVMIQSNGINLVDNQNLNNMIVNLCQKFEFKMKSQLTLGVIFDCRYKDVSLIDALVNENISPLLDSKYSYFIQGDESTKETKVDHSTQEVKMISVPMETWKPFSNSIMLLSTDNYKDFMTQIKERNIYDPDVLVLVLKSTDELQDLKVQSFLSCIANQYTDGNFIVVLNDAESIECTDIDYCDVCYPENIRLLLQEIQLNLENRIFKMSASRILKSAVDLQAVSPESEYLNNNFKDFKVALQHELDINCVVDRFYKIAQLIGESMDELRKTFDENKLKEVINECETTFLNESNNVLQNIKTQESNSLKDANQMLDDKNNDDNEFLRNIIKKYMKKQCGNVRNDIDEKIAKIVQKTKIKNLNKELSEMTTNMFNKEYLRVDDFENKIDNFIFNDIDIYRIKDIKKENANLSNIKIENIDLNNLKNTEPKNQTVLYKFLKSTKNSIVEVFKIAKKSYETFIKSFKKRAEKIVETVKKTIDYTVRVSKELHLRHMVTECRKMKQLIEMRRKEIRNGINSHVDSINEKLISMDNEDLKTDKLGNILGDLVANFESVCDMSGIKNELYTQLQNTGSSDLSQKITEHFANEYKNKYLILSEVEKLPKQIKERMDKFYKKIDEKKFYERLKEDYIEIDNEKPKPIEELNIQKIDKTIIKTSELMTQLQLSTTDMIKLLNETSNKLNEGIDKFIQYMKNYSFEKVI